MKKGTIGYLWWCCGGCSEGKARKSSWATEHFWGKTRFPRKREKINAGQMSSHIAILYLFVYIKYLFFLFLFGVSLVTRISSPRFTRGALWVPE